MNPNSGKDTVYVDVDDEITAIIEKVGSSKQKIVALVLPKRASVLQSSVNMKLLKRSADNAQKNVVLVTTEAALMPLAGAAGLHVAKTPTSKPEIPAGPLEIHDGNIVGEEEDLDLDDEPESEYTADNAGNKPVGELAKKGSGAAALGAAPDAIETVRLDDEEDAAPSGKVAAGASAAAVAGKAAKKPKDPKIPNFSRFQKQLALGVLALVVLLVGLYFATAVLPRAHITIDTDATDYNSSLNMTLDSGASEVSLAKNTIPATIAQQQKTYSQQVAATGQQNNGQKATGSVTMSAQVCAPNLGNDPSKVPAGTGISSGGQTYITQDTATFNQGKPKGSCIYYTSNSVDITAQKAGASYNTGGTNFTVSGRSDASASGSANGGTDEIVKIVSQSDVDSATAKLTQQDTSAVKTALEQQLRTQNLYPVTATFSSGTPNTTTSTPVGQPADAVTVTQAVTYTMYGTRRANLDQLIQNDIKQQIDPATQAILNDGLDKANIKLTSNTDTTAQISLQTTATVGPKLDVASLKSQIAGKKTGYVKSLIGNQPGVTNVTVKLSPFWVSSVPKSTHKINITVGKAASADSTSNGSGQ
jgi:hypothetical protein